MGAFIVDVAATVTASSVILGVVGYLLLPRCRDFVWSVLQTNPEKYDKLRFDSILRSPEQVSIIVKRALATELAEFEHVKKQVNSHDETMNFLQNAITEQGKEMKQLPLIASAIQTSARAVEEVARTVHEIHREVQDHGRRLERWDGYMEGKSDGERDAEEHTPERRIRKRRKTDR